MTNQIFPIAPTQNDDATFPVIELTEAELLEVAGGRRCGAGSGGKVGEVPVVTG